MAKSIKRILAMVMVMAMFVSVLPMQALAAETEYSTETSPEGLPTDKAVTTDTQTNEAGNTVVTVTIQKDTVGTLENGAELERHETSVETVETDENGNVIRSTGVIDGEEIITNISPDPEVGVEVAVPDEVGEENANSKEFGAVPEITTGDKKEGEDDTEYNQTTTTVIPGEVTITTTGKEYSQEFTDRDGLEYTHGTVTPDGTNDVTHKYCADEQYLPGYEGEFVQPEMVEGYDYIFVGGGLTSKFVPARVHTEPWTREQKIAEQGDKAFMKPGMGSFQYYWDNLDDSERDSVAYDENGNYVVDEEGFILNKDGERIVKGERTHVDPNGNTTYLHRFDNFKENSTTKIEGWYEDGEWIVPVNGTGYIAMWDGPQQYLLVDSNGNIITTYCADQSDPTEDFYGYNIENLEDATYYSEEEAARIRSIAKNGYWGVEGTDEGSLEYLKQALLASGQFEESDLASLNDGVALTATQMAIWSCSNKMAGIDYVGAHYAEWGAGAIPAGKEDEVELMFEIYNYLINLEGTEVEGKMTDTVITAENAIQNMNVTVIEKAEDHENNKDDDKDNDAYVTDLSFALVVEPTGDDEESLKVTLVTSDGQTIVGRICGTKESEDEVDLDKDEEGNYWFRNIVLTEGGQTFTLNLEGVQNLDQGVYLYSSEVREGSTSQTLVGKAGGTRDFDVTIDLSFNMDVQDKVVVEEHIWHNEYDPIAEPEVPEIPEEPEEEPEPPQIFRLDPEAEEEIPEEPVPLAAPVTTGDNSFLWILVVMMSVFGIVVINVSAKKKYAA